MANLILGLGGTGAKVVESFIHLCATGLGPDHAAVAFIDQDRANGNTRRSRATLGRYMAARDALWGLPAEHRHPACDLLRTELEPHSDLKDAKDSLEACHWIPQRGNKVSLDQLIQYDLPGNRAKGLADALFRYNDELCMQLNEGYRGRPHVGSVALLLELESDEFWRSIEDVVREAQGEVRIFLCGSAFGGTGAAVLPTLARRLRRVAKEGGRPLFTGASLMLPYFTFDAPDEREANVATGSQLLLQSQSALEYYHSDIQSSQSGSDGETGYSFDDLYLVGWNPLIKLNYHSPGSATQENPPLAPELFGALAATKFFQEPKGRLQDGGGSKPTALHVISRAAALDGRGEIAPSESGLHWEDLPDGSSVRTAYAMWLRFCALWYFDYAMVFPALCVVPAGVQKKTWFRRHADGPGEAWFRRYVGDATVSDDAVKALDEYIAMALRYAAAMSAFSKWNPRHSFNLWGDTPIAELDVDNPPTPPRLENGTLARGNWARDFTGLIRGLSRPPRDAAEVYWALAAGPSPNADPSESSPKHGLWQLIANLHRCSAP